MLQPHQKIKDHKKQVALIKFKKGKKKTKPKKWIHIQLMMSYKTSNPTKAIGNSLTWWPWYKQSAKNMYSVNSHDQFESTTFMWMNIVTIVDLNGYFPLPKNNIACKDKWGALYGYFKHVFDYMVGTSHNIKDWDLTPQEKATLNFPQHCNKHM